MALTRVEYWRWATLLPVLAPLSLGAGLWASQLLGAPSIGWLDTVAYVAGMGILFFGHVYLVIVAAMLYALRRSTWKAHAKAAAVAPWLMVIGAGVFAAVVDLSENVWSRMYGLTAFCLVLGYGYVALVFLGMVALVRVGWIVEDAASQ